MNQVTIKNEFISLSVLDFGAIIQKLEVKDKYGNFTNVVAGFEDLTRYISDPFFLGACIGRYAGRVSGGGFYLDGKYYPLHTEDDVHLHGGKEGFGKKFWTIEKVEQGTEPQIWLSYQSDHLEEGYPGRLEVSLSYKLVDSSLRISHRAVTDRPTVVNLTNHSYFHLDEEPTIAAHLLQLNCESAVETHPNLLPTGELKNTANTSYDFSKMKPLGNASFDTPFVVFPGKDAVATITSPTSGIQMDVFTNQPAVVIFTPKSFPGICFETQNYPDAPNIQSFPDSRLAPGETYLNETVFKFDLVN